MSKIDTVETDYAQPPLQLAAAPSSGRYLPGFRSEIGHFTFWDLAFWGTILANTLVFIYFTSFYASN
jgi:hypothetical protein